MTHDSRAIANFLLDDADRKNLRLSNLVILKILYFSHATYLLEHNKSLLRDDFEAWEHGPVIRIVYENFKSWKDRPIKSRAKRINFDTGENEAVAYTLDSEETSFLKKMLDTYVKIPPFVLSEMSHEKGGPWDYVWNQPDGRTHLGMVITDSIIRAKFMPQMDRKCLI
ncbi:Panacea domain-containing protein [Ferrovibrio sp.]|uniref:Panacea domain-containing protein n=1 Tax=Ferrovibrio sp. TaxID=1917215 RepID=UPI003D0B70D9